jgi:hypothetical protein
MPTSPLTRGSAFETDSDGFENSVCVWTTLQFERNATDAPCKPSAGSTAQSISIFAGSALPFVTKP